MRPASAIAFVLATLLGAMAGHDAELKMDITANHDATAPLSAAEEQVLKPKDSFKECAQCPEMVVVPAGSFTMGSPDGEEGRIEEEGPQHRVTFGRSFGVGKFAVTFEEWDACVADSGCNGYMPSDEGWGRWRRPVINVSWDDAKAYVRWLSRKTGKSYRLLSEAEREYVTRAGTTTPFWWGASISTQQANYNGNYAYGAEATGVSRRQTVPVDSFEPNPWGSTRFMAMCGNGRKTVGTTTTRERPRMARL
jgi:formylglycine-generating enzyme required for sulfatase activity